MTIVFFFNSGYGLMYNFLNKKDYLKSFLKKRLLTIVIPYTIANIAYIIMRYIKGNMLSVPYIIKSLLNGDTVLVPYSWYVIVIFIMYIIFYISFRWLDVKKGLGLCIILNLIYIFTMLSIDFVEWWYNTVFAFSFGLLFAYYFEKADMFLKKNAIVKFLVSAGIFGALLICGKIVDIKLVLILIKICRAVVFSILILYLSMLLKNKNKILIFLGNISFEIYLYQGMIIGTIMNTTLKNTTIGASVVILVLTILLAFMFNIINSFALKKICK